MKKLIVILFMLLSVFCSASWAAEIVANGDTSRSFYLVMRDRNGDPNTAITVTTLDINYCVEGGATVSDDCTDLGSEDAAWSSLGCYEMSTSGLYRFDIPNAALAGGAGTTTNVWITDSVSGTRVSYLAIMLSPPVDSVLVGGATPTSRANNIADVETALGNTGLVLTNTTIAAYTSNTSFTLTAGPAHDTAVVGCTCIIIDQADTTQVAVGRISAYTTAANTVTLESDPLAAFTFANGDTVLILPNGRGIDTAAILADTAAQDTADEMQTLVWDSTTVRELTHLDEDSTTIDMDATTVLTNVTGLVIASGTLGATANDTTHLHLDGLTQGNDELNGHLITIYDDSASEYHSTWIDDWVLSSELAQVATLPFTPEASTDTYWILAVKKDPDTASILEDTGTTLEASIAAIGNVATLQGTASAGSSTTITLTDGIATAGWYDGQLVKINSGKGAGQSRRILTYADNRIATVTRDWVTAPDNTSVFTVYADDYPAILEAGTAQAGAAATITLDTSASTTVNLYANNWIMITGGTGAGQTRLISAYSAGRVATITPVWVTNPDATSVYQIVPAARVDVSKIAGTLQTANDNGADINAILADTEAMEPIITDLAGISELGDKVTADMDANSLLVHWTEARADIVTDLAGISEIGDKVVADMDANSTLDDILTDTAVIGALGVGLTAIPWNSDWDEEVESEVEDAVGADVTSILEDTGTTLAAAIAAVPTVAEIWATAMVDLAAGAPPYNASAKVALNYIFEAWRNKIITTTAEVRLYKDDGTTILTESDISDDGTSFTKSEYGAED